MAPFRTSLGSILLLLATVWGSGAGCSREGSHDNESVASSEQRSQEDCNGNDGQGRLLEKARSSQVFDARLTWRQTNNGGQGISAACDFSTGTVTHEGMADVTLHCGGTQRSKGYARVAARWGTNRLSEACTRDHCAVIFVEDGSGARREVVRDIYLKDRFYCEEVQDRNDQRLDVDGCTYAEVVAALKQTGRRFEDDQSNLSFEGGRLSGSEARGLRLKYAMYPCDSGPSSQSSELPSPRSESSLRRPTRPIESAFEPFDTSEGRPTSTRSLGSTETTPTGVFNGGHWTCRQFKEGGHCGDDWMQSNGWCASTCSQEASMSRVTSTPMEVTSRPLGVTSEEVQGAPDVGEVTPTGVYNTGNWTCPQFKAGNHCNEDWMTSHGWCAVTCGSE